MDGTSFRCVWVWLDSWFLSLLRVWYCCWRWFPDGLGNLLSSKLFSTPCPTTHQVVIHDIYLPFKEAYWSKQKVLDKSLTCKRENIYFFCDTQTMSTMVHSPIWSLSLPQIRRSSIISCMTQNPIRWHPPLLQTDCWQYHGNELV